MTNPYTTQAIANYNTSPPPDDGTAVVANQLSWAKHKDKLADPIKVLAEAINTELVATFAKLHLNQKRAITVNDTQLAADERKLISATNTITYTLLPAVTAGDGFTVAVLNAGTGIITIDGNASELISGSLSITLDNQRDVVFLRCDGVGWDIIHKHEPRRPGTWELIGVATASNSVSIDFNWGATVYREVLLIVDNASPIADGNGPKLLTSSDDGATFDTAASSYAYSFNDLSMATTPVSVNSGSAGFTSIGLSGGIGNAANEFHSCSVRIFNPSVAAFTSMTFEGIAIDTVGIAATIKGSAVRLSAADVNAIRYEFAASNISAGNFVCYGLI